MRAVAHFESDLAERIHAHLDIGEVDAALVLRECGRGEGRSV